MSLTVEELKAGIAYWRKADWPQDLHNDFYPRMADANPNGVFNQEWWDPFLNVLSQWIATRPRSHTDLTERAQARFQLLSDTWVESIAPHLNNDIGELEWQQIAAFPTLVAEIKDVSSPVFASKFCHFLAPAIFPVIDNEAMGNPFPTYEAYFTTGRTLWVDTDPATQETLVSTLTREIGEPLCAGYPLKTKLIELCLTGKNQMILSRAAG